MGFSSTIIDTHRVLYQRGVAFKLLPALEGTGRGGECVTAAYSQGAGADLEKKKDKPKIKHSSGVRGVGVGYLVNLFKLTIISTHLAGIR